MINETNIKKLENGRAEFAYKCVDEAKKPEYKIEGNVYKFKHSDYKSYVKKLPALIQTNGLGNTLAYMVSKGKTGKNEKNAYDLLYEQLSRWLKEGGSGYALLSQEEDLLEFVISQPTTVYRQVTSETLAFLNWLRRLAEGLIEGDTNE